jgi:hypothetical protein
MSISVRLDIGRHRAATLDVYRTRLLKPVLKFKLHPVPNPEIVHSVAACPRPLKMDFLPIFGQNAARTVP